MELLCAAGSSDTLDMIPRDSQSLLSTAQSPASLLAANYCSPWRKPIIIQRKIKVLSDLGLQPDHTPCAASTAQAGLLSGAPTTELILPCTAELLTRALSSELIIINVGLS